MSKGATQLGDNVPNNRKRFGWFKGVFVPSILTIFGVVMYLRLGWVAGNAGPFGTFAIVTISSAITFLTALSISSIATNMRIGAGGAYYMISRSFGLEAGAAVGVPLFFAQALGISFYISGFAESVHFIFPELPVQAVAVGGLIFLAILVFVSADLALKAQFFVLAVIIASLASFFLGSYSPAVSTLEVVKSSAAPFWVVFAVFFPAVTGIEAGVAMSGDLKNPARALPLGTILAVVVGYLVYLIIPFVLLKNVPLPVLLSNNSIVQQYALVGAVVVAGIWGATLSSALGSLLGGPRTLQAMAQDAVVPRFLGRGYGSSEEPRVGTVFAFLVALAGVLLGDLNAIAPVLSMFFLTSYGFLNLITALEGMIGSPSWRPSFRTPWMLSLIGAFGCFSAMLMIDAGATFVAGFLTILIYWITKKRKFRTRWFDMRRGILLLMARYAIYRLDGYAETTKTWRPNLLVLSGSPNSRWHLIELAHALSHGKGFLTVAAIVPRLGFNRERLLNMEKSIRDFLSSRKVNALVEVNRSDDHFEGAQNLIRNYGMGPLFPNIVVMGCAEDPKKYASFSEVIFTANRNGKNLLLVRKGESDPKEFFNRPAKRGKKSRRIDIWWGGAGKKNPGLMLALGYLLKTSPQWRDTRLVLRTLVGGEEEKDGAQTFIDNFLKSSRIDAETEVSLRETEGNALDAICQISKDADLVFIGLKLPTEESSVEEYGAYYAQLIERTASLPQLLLVMASQDIEFEEIFV